MLGVLETPSYARELTPTQKSAVATAAAAILPASTSSSSWLDSVNSWLGSDSIFSFLPNWGVIAAAVVGGALLLRFAR